MSSDNRPVSAENHDEPESDATLLGGAGGIDAAPMIEPASLSESIARQTISPTEGTSAPPVTSPGAIGDGKPLDLPAVHPVEGDRAGGSYTPGSIESWKDRLLREAAQQADERNARADSQWLPPEEGTLEPPSRSQLRGGVSPPAASATPPGPPAKEASRPSSPPQKSNLGESSSSAETVVAGPALRADVDSPTPFSGQSTQASAARPSANTVVAPSPVEPSETPITVVAGARGRKVADPSAQTVTAMPVSEAAESDQTFIGTGGGTDGSGSGLGTAAQPGSDSLHQPTLGLHSDELPEQATQIGGPEIAAGPSDATVVRPQEDRTLIESRGGEDPSHAEGATLLEAESYGANVRVTLNRPKLAIGPWSTVAEGMQAHKDVDRYEQIENFAQGGLGRIWRARDRRIQREVAYKELLPSAVKNQGLLERFLEEAQITGQLEHPGIVPIYDLGWQPDGTPFYAMKLVRGETYLKAIRACHELPTGSTAWHLAFNKLLQQFVDICNAIAFAHDRGVIHRDLKPHNVMLGAFGETLVLDWGLAKIIGTVDRLDDVTLDLEAMDDETPAADVSGPGPAASSGTGSRTDALPDATPAAVTVDVRADAGQDRHSAPTMAANQAGATPAGSPAGDSKSGSGSVTGPVPGTAMSGMSGSGSRAASRAGSGSLGSGMHSGITSASAAGSRPGVITNVRSEASQTLAGSVMGTPAYMPPEQAEGRSTELDARADIYSLGAILYEVLTGRQPIQKGKVVDMLKRVVAAEYPPPRAVDPTLSRALEAICLKAMAHDRANRYPTALSLAADVERYLADEPVSVYAEPWQRRVWRWIRQHRTTVTVAGSTVCLLLAGAIGWNRIEASRLNTLADRVRKSQDSAAQLATSTRYFEAREQLVEALGRIDDEPRLATLSADVNRDLAQLDEQIKLARAQELSLLKNELQQELKSAETIFAVQKDFNRATALLTSVLARTQDQPELAEIRDQSRMRLSEIEKEISTQAARTAAVARRERFHGLVDRAQFYGSQFNGDQLAANARQALSAVREALALYRFEQQPKLAAAPEYLSASETERLQTEAYELFLIASEAEQQLVSTAEEADRAAGLKKSLQWLDRADETGQQSRAGLELRAALLQQLGERDAAEKFRQQASQKQATTAWEFVRLGEVHRRDAKQYLEAIELYRQALELDPHFFLAHYFTGVANLQYVQSRPAVATTGPAANREDDSRGYLNASVTAFTACLTERPDFPWPRLLRGVALAGLGLFDAAHADFDAAEKTPAETIGLFDPTLFQYALKMNRGSVDLQQKRYREAAQLFEEAAALKPENADPLMNLSLVQRAQEQDETALATLTRAIEKEPTRAQAYRLRAEEHLRLGAGDAAEEDFRRVIDLDDSETAQAAALTEIAKIHFRAGRIPQAIVHSRQALVLAPQDAATHRLLAEALLANKQDAEATEEFTKFLELDQPVGDVYRARGLAFAKQKKYRQAINDYTRSLELEASPNILTRRGWAYLLQSQQLALQDFDESIRLNPENGDSYNGRGFARALLGDDLQAVQDAEQAVKLGPKAFEMLYNAATIYGQSIAAVRKDSQRDEETRQALTKKYLTRAIELLQESEPLLGPQRAILAPTLQADAAWDSVRSEPEFQAYLKTLTASPDRNP